MVKAVRLVGKDEVEEPGLYVRLRSVDELPRDAVQASGD